MKVYYGRISPDREEDAFVDGGDGKLQRLNPRYDICNHSPDGFAWGYGGSGPAQLALAILCDALSNDRRAEKLYQRFKDTEIASLPKDAEWSMTELHVLNRVHQLEAGL